MTRQRIIKLEAHLAENSKRVATMQKEIEEGKQEKAQQEKTIRELTNRIKGNITLLDARRLIWTEIITEVKKRWAFLNIIEEIRAAVRVFRRTLHEGGTDASNRVQSAKRYISFLKELSPKELVKWGIRSRFKETVECQKVIDKEYAHSMALNILEKVAASLEQFEADWMEITLAGLPSCWEPSNAVLQSLSVYECRLKEVMNQTDIPSEKSARLKAETIVSVLGKEFSLLHQVKYKIPTHASFDELTEVYIKAEVFTAMLEPAIDT